MTDVASTGLVALSDDLAAAVNRAGRHLLSVSARRRQSGTGILWKPGVVVTADHVIERDEGIEVAGPNGESVKATLKGRDPSTDLAMLAIEGETGAVPADPATAPARVGELVLAVARPREGGLSVSFGAVGGVGEGFRTWGGGRIDQLIRADVTFYPGFSGGALVNASGDVMGLNTSGLARGLALTIPTVTVERVAGALLESGRIQRGYLGVRMQSVELPPSALAQQESSDGRGLLVVSVEPGSPAENAGALVGDILVTLNGHRVTEADVLQSLLDPETVGQTVELGIVRGGAARTLSAVIAGRPQSNEGQRRSGHGRRRGHHDG